MKMKNNWGIRKMAHLGVVVTVLAAFCGASAAEGVNLSEWRPLAAQHDFYNDDSLSGYAPFTVDKSGGFSAAGLAGIPIWGKIVGIALIVGAAGYSVGKNKDKNSGNSGSGQCERRVFARPTDTWDANPNGLALPFIATTTLSLSALTPFIPSVSSEPLLISLSRSLQDQNSDFKVGTRSFLPFIQKVVVGSGKIITVSGVETTVAIGRSAFFGGAPAGATVLPVFSDGLTAVPGDKIIYSSAVFTTITLQTANGLVDARSLDSTNPRTEIFRVYREAPLSPTRIPRPTVESSIVTLFLASEIRSSCGGDLANGEFFLAPSFIATTEYSTDNLMFRRDNLRGWINPETAVQLGNFLFTADSQLQNMHMENRSELFADKGFSLFSASGFRRQDEGKTSVIYSKITAMKALTPQVDVYVQTSHGSVNSDIYNDASLSGLSFGVFAERLLRWDDSAHLSLERRFADAEEELWQLSANIQIGGDEESHVRFGFNQGLSGGTQANILYRRQF